MSFRPIFEWILVEEEAPMTQTESGIYLPIATSKKQLIKKCKVLQIGERARELMKEEGSIEYEVGDMVMHHSQTGIKVDSTNEKDRRYFLKYDGVLAVCNREGE
jgi:co-chaperonin GroES (HSP10)